MEIDSDTHLAVSYSVVVDRLKEPEEVLNELKDRAGELGIISSSAEPHEINDLGREMDIHIDFYSVPPGKLKGLMRAKKQDHPDKTKYVFIGDSRRDEVAADKAEWGYLDLDSIAQNQGWELNNNG